MDIHWQLTEIYGEEFMSVQHFHKWDRAFADGRTEIHDEERNRRPPVSDAIVQKNNSELLIDFMQPGTTINSQNYCETLTKLRRAIQNRRRGQLTEEVVLLHDNAQPYAARQTQELLKKIGGTVMPHPPYSPDLAPSDHHLFPKLKDHKDGKHFKSEDEVRSEVTRFLEGLAGDFFDLGIQKLEHRLQKCVEKNRDYVEKKAKV